MFRTFKRTNRTRITRNHTQNVTKKIFAIKKPSPKSKGCGLWIELFLHARWTMCVYMCFCVRACVCGFPLFFLRLFCLRFRFFTATPDFFHFVLKFSSFPLIGFLFFCDICCSLPFMSPFDRFYLLFLKMVRLKCDCVSVCITWYVFTRFVIRSFFVLVRLCVCI